MGCQKWPRHCAVLQFFSLISDDLGGVKWLQLWTNFKFFHLHWCVDQIGRIPFIPKYHSSTIVLLALHCTCKYASSDSYQENTYRNNKKEKNETHYPFWLSKEMKRNAKNKLDIKKTYFLPTLWKKKSLEHFFQSNIHSCKMCLGMLFSNLVNSI